MPDVLTVQLGRFKQARCPEAAFLTRAAERAMRAPRNARRLTLPSHRASVLQGSWHDKNERLVAIPPTLTLAGVVYDHASSTSHHRVAQHYTVKVRDLWDRVIQCDDARKREMKIDVDLHKQSSGFNK